MRLFNVRALTSAFFATVLLLSGMASAASIADTPSVAAPLTATAYLHQANTINGVQIVDAAAAIHPGAMALDIASTDGAISMAGAHNISAQHLKFIGTLAQVNEALKTLSYTPSAQATAAKLTFNPWNQTGHNSFKTLEIEVTATEPVNLCLAAHATVSVKSFGAKGDGVSDDTAALQKALSQAAPGSILLLPAGHYVISKSLNFTQSEVALVGENATLVATTPTDQTLHITGNHSAVVNVAFQGVGTVRASNPASTKIEVSGEYDQIIGNTIKGGASVGIFVYNAQHFLIQNNTVSDTLADGIHMTGPSNFGIVTGNTVSASGDDMIAVVSYEGSGAMALAPDSNILIANNNVSGGLARGITVVGGQNVTIKDNMIANIGSAAGIYIADEVSQYDTLPVANILVEGNTLSNIETVPHPTGSSWAHQAAINIYTNNGGSIQNVSVQNNTVNNAYLEGIRLDASCRYDAALHNYSAACTLTNPSSGYVCSNTVLGNTLLNTNGGIATAAAADCPAGEANVCIGNTLNGAAISSTACTGTTAPTITGSAYTVFGQDASATGSWASCQSY